MLECVVNISEGRDHSVLDEVVAGAGEAFLDLHVDADHHRSVVTLGGPGTEEAVRRVARVSVERIRLDNHSGVHPRFGALDVVPFVPLGQGGSALAAVEGGEFPDGTLQEAVDARDRFASWAARELGVPCFLYGPERTLPDLRRRAFVDLLPEFGPTTPHPSTGACAVGARFVLVAYNLWLETADIATARSIAREMRGPHVRALGLPVGAGTQVSCNLLDPFVIGPEEAYDSVAEMAATFGTELLRAELVGLVPSAVVESIPPERRAELDVDPDRTIEARLSDAKSRSPRG